jgi:hypothetical protein
MNAPPNAAEYANNSRRGSRSEDDSRPDSRDEFMAVSLVVDELRMYVRCK